MMRAFGQVLAVWSLLLVLLGRTALAQTCEYPIDKQHACPHPTQNSEHLAASNTCGPSGGGVSAALTAVIPNTYPAVAYPSLVNMYVDGFGRANFAGACDKHDICYGTCGTSKESCDDDLAMNMLKACSLEFPISPYDLAQNQMHDNCRHHAYVYWEAVRHLGSSAFQAGQDVACECCRTSSDGGLNAGLASSVDANLDASIPSDAVNHSSDAASADAGQLVSNNASIPAGDAGAPPAKIALAGGWGEPHLYTWDGYHYDFQHVGEFVLVQDGPLTVQIRLHPYGTSTTVATIWAVAANVDGDRAEIVAGTQGPIFRVNGTLSSPGMLPHGGELSAATLTWADGTVLQFTGHGTYLSVQMKRSKSASTGGLLGDADDVTSDDFRLRDGTVLKAPLSQADRQQFASAWRISQAESLFSYGSGEDTNPYTDLSFPSSEVRAGSLTSAQYGSARTTCMNAGVSDLDVLDACILDVGTTGDVTFADGLSSLPAPLAANAAIYEFSTDTQSLKVDLVSSSATPISADGRMDGVFDATVRGPVSAFVLASTDANGAPAGGSYWETLVGTQTIPSAISGLSGASTTWDIGVEENGTLPLINNADGSIPPLSDGVHQLTIYASNDGGIRTGQYLRLFAIDPSGGVAASPVLVY